MPCEKCNGYWQCSPEEDPCSLAAADPIGDPEIKCFQVLTKKPGGSDCMMQIRCSDCDGDVPGGWEDAGLICFEFQLYQTGDTCFVKAAPKDCPEDEG